MIRRPPRSTLSSSSAASDVYKRQVSTQSTGSAHKDMGKYRDQQPDSPRDSPSPCSPCSPRSQRVKIPSIVTPLKAQTARIGGQYHSRRVSTLRPVSASNNSCVGVGSRGVSRPRSAPPKSTKRGETQRLRKQVHMRELELEKAREELNLLREEKKELREQVASAEQAGAIWKAMAEGGQKSQAAQSPEVTKSKFGKLCKLGHVLPALVGGIER
eukprot:TRINITY_DN3710_c0_g1_i13.p1 TRINITY_DN3710_c0_g1~~TRINITY_DN3710_c0_g1_i13.p1  ORF type:complete len:214 (+),score=33.25 TRINITY_DN3710_c0_g1_i13:114-755(+)